MNSSTVKKLAPFLPYLAVLCGLYWLHSAWVAVLLYHLGIVVMLSGEKQWAHGRTLFAGYAPWQVPATALGGIGAGAVLYLLWPLLGMPAAFGGKLAGFGLTSSLWPFFFGYFILVNPWLEELYWRAYLGHSSLRPAWNDLCFAGYHLLVLAFFVRWPWLLLTLCALVAVAWIWRQLARQQHGLCAPMLSHVFADAGTMAVIYYFAVRIH
jgi:hypothetical protein